MAWRPWPGDKRGAAFRNRTKIISRFALHKSKENGTRRLFFPHHTGGRQGFNPALPRLALAFIRERRQLPADALMDGETDPAPGDPRDFAGLIPLDRKINANYYLAFFC